MDSKISKMDKNKSTLVKETNIYQNIEKADDNSDSDGNIFNDIYYNKLIY